MVAEAKHLVLFKITCIKYRNKQKIMPYANNCISIGND